MKIEKISDSQIRCTLSKDDLIDRELKISELAYGTEKAKALFRDMIQQAFYEFGFEVDDIPLMIEAIPISPESLVLVITKVEDPDELDTRFSKFSAFGKDSDSDGNNQDSDSYEDDIMDNFQEDAINNNKFNDFLDIDNSVHNDEKDKTKTPSNLTKVFRFNSLSEVTALASTLVGFYRGINTLYKNREKSVYFLVLSRSDHTLEEFNQICNIASEFGDPQRSTYATIVYYEEHYEVIVKDQALQILSVM